MLTVIIVEDEQPARDKLRAQIAQISNLEIIGEADSGDAAIAMLSKLDPDIVFMDIHLGTLSGLDVLDTLDIHSHIIFTTAHSEYALQAFEKRAIDYLLKPFNLTRLKEAVARIPVTLPPTESIDAPAPGRIPAKVGDKIHLLRPDDIAFIQSRHGISFAQLQTRECALELPLEKLQMDLPHYFLRIHRNCIANIHYISLLERWRNGNYLVRFYDLEQTVTTSRQGSQQLKRTFKL